MPGRALELAIFTSHPIQYQVPVFRELAARTDIQPSVFYGSDHGISGGFDVGFDTEITWDIPLLGGYRHTFLRNEASRPNVNSFMGISVPSIRNAWHSREFDAAMIMGWQSRGHIQALLAAWHSGIPVVLFGESTLAMRPAAAWKAALRAGGWLPVRRVLYSQALKRIAGVLTTGKRNEEYFRSFGVGTERLFRVGYSVENDRFMLTADERGRARTSIRSALGLSGNDFVFLAVAKLQEKKRPLDLLEAFSRIRPAHPEAALIYVGDGPEREKLKMTAKAAAIDTRVRIAGFVNQKELPEWYAAADCLVLPSDARETWGLAVNEALAAGLPTIVSDAVGCSPDLIVNGENGKVFPLGDLSALSSAMSWVAETSSTERSRISENAQRIVADYSPRKVAERMAIAIRALTVR